MLRALEAKINEEEVAGIVDRASLDHVQIADAIGSADVVGTAVAAAAHLSEVEHRMIEKLV